MSDFVIAILILVNIFALALAWRATVHNWQDWNEWVREMREKYQKEEE